MMKLLAFSTLALLAGVANCAQPVVTKGMSRRAMRSGGFLERQIEGKRIQIINAQTKVDSATIQEAADSIKQLISLAIVIVNAEPNTSVRSSAEHPVTILIKNDPKDDATILIAPEQTWGSININALCKDAPTDEVLSARVCKEVWRVLAIALGASNSTIQPCLLAQVNSLADLDRLRGRVPSPEPFNVMISTASKLGIARSMRCTYKRACEEGWAPAPTNDIQKAIWDKVHQLPTKPIQILPETKPVKD